jgi:hypothetical protein|tara:strand:+ start:6603 stop:6920 length:318 start_codon:yes stop_codon:yes gene_type:complete
MWLVTAWPPPFVTSAIKTSLWSLAYYVVFNVLQENLGVASVAEVEFVQVDPADEARPYRDSFRFKNGHIILLQDLVEKSIAVTVLALPVRKQASKPAHDYHFVGA